MPITGLIDQRLLPVCKDQLQRAVASVEHADVAHVAHVPKDGLSLTRFSRDAVADVETFNQAVAKKSPELLREKYTRMSKDPFAFFRGTDHLFYQDLQRLDGKRLAAGPATLVQGDLHLGNFGTIQRLHRGLDVGANDFDEAHVGPVTLDLQRFATSVVLQARQMGLSGSRTHQLVTDFADTYTRTLDKVTSGEINLTPRAPESVRKLLVKSSSRDALAAVDKKAPAVAGARALKRDAFNTTVSAVTRRDVDAAYRRFVASLPAKDAAGFAGYRVSDVVSSVAGVGSVGRSRYRLLLEGPAGRPPRLFEMKEEVPSALAPVLPARFPGRTEATRAIAASEVFDGDATVYLGQVTLPARDALESRSFVVREVPATKGSVDLAKLTRADDLADLLDYYAKKLAWGHARGKAVGLAGAREIRAGLPEHLGDDLADFGRRYARQVERDHADFVKAFSAGKLSVSPKA